MILRIPSASRVLSCPEAPKLHCPPSRVGTCLLLTYWLAQGLAVKKAQSRYWRGQLVPRCFVLIHRAGVCMLTTCNNPRCLHECCWLCLHEWTGATNDAVFCTVRAKTSHSRFCPRSGRHAPIGRNRCTTRDLQRTLMRRRYFSASAWHSPHVLKV